MLATVYLGDRLCTRLVIDGWKEQVSLHVDVISRIRGCRGDWDYYTDEDIVDGRLVFTGVTRLRLEPSGPVPNDLINQIQVLEVNVPQSSRNEFLFRISVGSVDEAGSSNEVLIEIQAKDLHLEDPAKPGEIIGS